MKDNDPAVTFYGLILNGATDHPLTGVTIEDVNNRIKVITNEDGHYTFDIGSAKTIQLPLLLEIQKPGFEKFMMPIRSLKDAQGEIKNNLYMLNVSLPPQGQAAIKPTSVFLGFKRGSDGYTNLKRFWDSISVKESLSSSQGKQKGIMTISGIVVDGDNLQPLENVLVKSSDQQVKATTNNKGFFTLNLQRTLDENNDVNLVYTGKGYTEFKSSFTSGSNEAATPYQIANVGMVKEGKADTQEKPFSASGSQDSEISYKDATEALQSYLHQSEIEKKLEAEHKVIILEDGTLYIFGYNVKSSYSVTATPKIYVNGKIMSIGEINSSIDAKNIQHVSSQGENEIAITLKN